MAIWILIYSVCTDFIAASGKALAVKSFTYNNFVDPQQHVLLVVSYTGEKRGLKMHYSRIHKDFDTEHCTTPSSKKKE